MKGKRGGGTDIPRDLIQWWCHWGGGGGERKEGEEGKVCGVYLCSVVLFGYWFSENVLNQSNPFCTSIISSNQMNGAHSDDTIINNGHFSHRKILCGLCK